MSGRDVAIAAMLGAEGIRFWHRPACRNGLRDDARLQPDTCPMGICTQNPELRKHFIGKPNIS